VILISVCYDVNVGRSKFLTSYFLDVANVCLFLASEESSHMTCGCLEVGGKFTLFYDDIHSFEK